MYHITKEDAVKLLYKLRLIRQSSGEAIAFLEHMFQLQNKETGIDAYDPDEYLEQWIPHSHDAEANDKDEPLPREL